MHAVLDIKYLKLSVLLFQSVQTVLSCMTLLSITVCLLAHVGIVHSDHTPLLTVKQVCLTYFLNDYRKVGKIGGTKFCQMSKKVVLAIIILAFQHLQLNYVITPHIHFGPTLGKQSSFHQIHQILSHQIFSAIQ